MSRFDDLLAQLCPAGVPYARLGDVVERGSKMRWSDAQAKEYKYIDLTSVDRTAHAIVECSTITRENAPSRAQQIVREGDVLFGTTRPMLKRYAIVSSEFDGQIASTAYCVLRPKPDLILTEFLFYLLGTAAFYSFIDVNERGSAYPAIPDSVVKQFSLPVPPLEVQREVVQILSGFADRDAALARELQSELDARRKQYVHYRDSLLSCTGIEGVRSTTLGDLYESSSGLSKSADQFGYGHPFLSFKTVFENAVVPSELTNLVNSTEAEQSRYSIKAGDVFVTRTSEDLEGLGMSCAAVQDYPKATFNGFTKRLRPVKSDVIDPQFTAHFFRSSHFKSQIAQTAVLSTRKSLNDGILLRVRINLPPMDEQLRVVSMLDRLNDLVNELVAALASEVSYRMKLYEHYRERLLTFEEFAA